MREGFVPKINGGDDVAEVAEEVAAAGAVEEREPGDVAEFRAAEEEEEPWSAMGGNLESGTKLENVFLD